MLKLIRNKNIIAGLFLFVFSLCYLLLTTRIRIFTGPGAAALTSRSIPYVWGYLLMFLSIVLIIRELIKTKRGHVENDTETVAERKYSIKNVILTLLLLAVTIAGINHVGYLLSSMIFIFIEALILSKKDERNIVVAAIIAIVISILTDYVFTVLLGVMLPKGILGF